MLKRRNQFFITVVIAADIVLISLAWLTCYVIRFDLDIFPVSGKPPSIFVFMKLLPIVILSNLISSGFVGLYQGAKPGSRWKELSDVIKSAVLGWLLMLAAFYYLSATPYSRRMLILFFFANIGALLLSRMLSRELVAMSHSRGIGVHRVAIIGAGRLGQETLHRLRRHETTGMKVSYFIEDGSEVQRDFLHGVPVGGTIKQLAECLKRDPVDVVIVAVSANTCIGDILDGLAELPVSVSVVPDFSRSTPLSFSADDLGGLPLFHLRATPISGWRSMIKRSLDLASALCLLAVFSIPMLILAILIKLTSRGPVFFRQERMGLGGKPFMMLKFRSMRVEAENDTGPVWAKEDDPRRTLLGRFMRSASLDELPQLFNILKGDMSLVGPRPERPHFVEQFVKERPGYMLRHSVKAGLTGWAQVNGLRGNTSIRKRLQYDLYYINNWSLGFDLMIIFLTPVTGLVGRHAY